MSIEQVGPWFLLLVGVVLLGCFAKIAFQEHVAKSTLLLLLGLLDTPTRGEYILNGEPVANLTFSQRARIRNREIGFIFQSFKSSGFPARPCRPPDPTRWGPETDISNGEKPDFSTLLLQSAPGNAAKWQARLDAGVFIGGV